MTTTTDVCRVTVVGSARRIDLAVPATVTVSQLMPVLLANLEKPDAGAAPNAGGWALQRLGEQPFDPNGTPDSLDWLEGEELYLRRVEDALPELDFDDLADGIATTVNRRGDRWQPEYRRPLFLVLTAVTLLFFAYALTDRAATVLTGVGGFTVGGGLLLAAVLVARLAGDRPLSLTFGLGGALLTGLAATDLADGAPGRLVLTTTSLGVGAGATFGAAALLLVSARLWARRFIHQPLLVIAVIALAALSMLWLRTHVGMSRQAVAGCLAAAGFALIVFSPKAALRLARLRGLQLPKTGEELQFDNQPRPAAELAEQTAEADNYLTAAVVSVCLLMPYLMSEIMRADGWPGYTTVIVLSSALALRSRAFYGVAQRVALAAAGAIGFLMVLVSASHAAGDTERVSLLAGLIVLLGVMVMAAVRPWPRRLLPIWEFLATVFDVVTGLAVIPLVLELLSAYSWARGLFG
ncbi:type VII secretion integral membrane protein EccD [Actinoplanes subtropicus]|uniref:type VII secretion integral membrane protein EccD n=1 Tax=Actinoplanes subtropicus TaxID=543632 RepID=UPI0004C2FBA1|nr:type VII secretion integral membrane protein EccD [Actinoplanes subtropicus]